MTDLASRRIFDRRGGVAAGAAIAFALALGGCRTASLEDVAPNSLVPPTAENTAAVAPAEPQARDTATGETPEAPGARNSGKYPNLNIIPKGETEQLTAGDRAASIAELNSARKDARSTGGDSSEDEAERLRRIARKHAQETLEQIEEK